MTQAEVVSVLGKPDTVAATGHVTYLEYGYDIFLDGKVGAAETYFVRLADGKVDAFGQKGDFDTTKDPTIVVESR